MGIIIEARAAAIRPAVAHVMEEPGGTQACPRDGPISAEGVDDPGFRKKPGYCFLLSCEPWQVACLFRVRGINQRERLAAGDLRRRPQLLLHPDARRVDNRIIFPEVLSFGAPEGFDWQIVCAGVQL